MKINLIITPKYKNKYTFNQTTHNFKQETNHKEAKMSPITMKTMKIKQKKPNMTNL